MKSPDATDTRHKLQMKQASQKIPRFLYPLWKYTSGDSRKSIKGTGAENGNLLLIVETKQNN